MPAPGVNNAADCGGALITPLPGATPLKAGSASWPFFGIEPALVEADGTIIAWQPGQEISGNLVLLRSWPGQARTVFGDHERFTQTYFTTYRGRYFTGDGARRDKQGNFWIIGRLDDVLNVSGHRLGTAEIESALVAHPAVAEAAVIGRPDDMKGQAVAAFVTLKGKYTESPELRDELRNHVGKVIGAIAKPDDLHFVPGLPKTRSGKIMRRLLRNLAKGEEITSDLSTLENPAILEQLKEVIR